jgi:hypothetical protein
MIAVTQVQTMAAVVQATVVAAKTASDVYKK